MLSVQYDRVPYEIEFCPMLLSMNICVEAIILIREIKHK